MGNWVDKSYEQPYSDGIHDLMPTWEMCPWIVTDADHGIKSVVFSSDSL